MTCSNRRQSQAWTSLSYAQAVCGVTSKATKNRLGEKVEGSSQACFEIVEPTLENRSPVGVILSSYTKGDGVRLNRHHILWD